MEQPDNQNAGGSSTDRPVTSKRGGVRRGAGRLRKREIYATNIAEAEALICKELPRLIAKYFELAQGVKVAGKSGRGGRETVYERPPDGKVIADLLNRVMGKPVDRVETENVGEEAEAFVIVLPDNGRPNNASIYDPENGGLTYGLEK